MQYTKLEVIKMLVNTYNNIMKEIDPKKYYMIKLDTQEVICYRKKTWIGRDTELSRYTFDYVIQEAEGNL